MNCRRTVLYDRHVALGAKMVDFAGWEMPVQYPTGIVEEHLRTRRAAGLFDVSHMGRFRVSGAESPAFLDAALTNDAASLAPGTAQYTLIPTDTGGALDDAFLYRTSADKYLLVVNAGNRERDWARLTGDRARFGGVSLEDRSDDLAMISLQGPRAPEILGTAQGEPLAASIRDSPRNTVWDLRIAGAVVVAVRTGYAGEPRGFELMVPAPAAATVWDRLVQSGAAPVGLGARDTLRLEAGLPLYGHELGTDPEGREIPMYACPQARTALSPAASKSSFRGKQALELQAAAWRRIKAGDYRDTAELPRLVRQLALLEPGVARGGARILDAAGGRQIGWVTSGTVVPTWVFRGEGTQASITDASEKRSALLGLVDAAVGPGQDVKVDVRGRLLAARVVRRLLESGTPPYARPVAV